jgi:hypothetical protein
MFIFLQNKMKTKILLIMICLFSIINFWRSQFIWKSHEECKLQTGQQYLNCRANYNNNNGINLQTACKTNDGKNASYLQTYISTWAISEVDWFYKYSNKIYYYLWTFNWPDCYQNWWYYIYDCKNKKNKSIIQFKNSYYENNTISCSSPNIQKVANWYLISKQYWLNQNYKYNLLNINKKTIGTINLKNFSINKSIKDQQFRQEIKNWSLNLWREQNNNKYAEIENINDNLIWSIFYINYKSCKKLDCQSEETIKLNANINIIKKKIY